MIEEKAFKNWIVAKPAFSNQMNMLYVYKIHIDTCIMPKKIYQKNTNPFNKIKGK